MYRRLRYDYSLTILFLLSALAFASTSNAQNAVSSSPEDNFLDLIKKGDEAKVMELLKQQPSLISARTKNGTTPVLLAIYADHPNIAEAFIKTGVTLDIFEASATGRIERVKTLLQKDPSLAKAFSQDGWTALHLNWGHIDIVKLLLDAGSDVNAISKNKLTATPLQGAVVTNRIEIARLLIDRGAKVTLKGEGGGTSLHEAAGSGLIEFARLLLDHGADINARDDEGKTPLTIAIEYKQPEMEKFLAEHKGIK